MVAENKIDDHSQADSGDVMTDIRYICKSCSLITDALQKGCDVMQMPNGDIIISEIKTVTFLYTWDTKKGKLIRTQSAVKNKRQRHADEVEDDSLLDDDYNQNNTPSHVKEVV